MEEIENLSLQWGELRIEHPDDLPLVNEMVALDTVEDLEDPRGTRSRAVPQLGVERDRAQPLGLHRGPDLAFGECLGELGGAVTEHQCLAMLTEALLEREIRTTMKSEGLSAIP